MVIFHSYVKLPEGNGWSYIHPSSWPAFQAKSAKVQDALDQMQRNLRTVGGGMSLEANDAGYPLVN